MWLLVELILDDVTHVINYNLPDEIEITHRGGRTARADEIDFGSDLIKEVYRVRRY